MCSASAARVLVGRAATLLRSSLGAPDTWRERHVLAHLVRAYCWDERSMPALTPLEAALAPLAAQMWETFMQAHDDDWSATQHIVWAGDIDHCLDVRVMPRIVDPRWGVACDRALAELHALEHADAAMCTNLRARGLPASEASNWLFPRAYDSSADLANLLN